MRAQTFSNETPAYTLMLMIGLCVHLTLGKKDGPDDKLELQGLTQPLRPRMLWLSGKYSGSINMCVMDTNYRVDRMICV